MVAILISHRNTRNSTEKEKIRVFLCYSVANRIKSVTLIMGHPKGILDIF